MSSSEQNLSSDSPESDAGQAAEALPTRDEGPGRRSAGFGLLIAGAATFGLVLGVCGWVTVKVFTGPGAPSDGRASPPPGPGAVARKGAAEATTPPSPPAADRESPSSTEEPPRATPESLAASSGEPAPIPNGAGTGEESDSPPSESPGAREPAKSTAGAADSRTHGEKRPAEDADPPDLAHEDETKESPPSLADLRERLRRADTPPASLYAAVARSHSAASRHEKALTLLQEGLDAHPGDDQLFLARADALAEGGEAGAAWESLARTGRVGDPRFASRILEFGVRAGRYDETLVLLASAGDALPEWDSRQWATVALLYEHTGQYQRAIAATKRHSPKTPEVLRLRAQREKSRERFSEAIAHQQRYIAELVRPGPRDWRDLAALYRAAGEPGKADLAESHARRAAGAE